VSAHAATTERPPAGLAQTGGDQGVRGGWEGAPVDVGDGERRRGMPRVGGVTTWSTLAVAALLCLIAFVAGGGLSPGRTTTTEIALTIGSGAAVAAAVLLTPARRPAYGLWPVGLLLAFAALTALSVVWSVQPDNSWRDAGRMLAYASFFAAVVAVVRATPDRWPAVLGGVTLAAVVVCAYALLTKVFPDQLDAHDIYARLRAPYDYWNAIGLTAAMGVIGCLWLGARRAGHALLSALAYPAIGLLLVTLMLAYSRGALLALAVGVLAWFCIVPLRLRGATVLLVGGLGAGVVVAWDFSRHALSSEEVALGERVSAGHQLGVLLLAMLLVLSIAGVAIGFATARRPPSRAARRNAGAVIFTVLALAVVAFAGALAVSHRGLFGTISHGVSSLTDPNAPVPPNTPGRLTAVSSVRARYWNEALEIFSDHPLLGVGAAGYETARFRYRTETLEVKHAHGFVVQTLADLGLVGLALALALFVAWAAAAGRPTHPFDREWRRWRWRASPTAYTPERIAMLTMLSLVVVFGVHSFVDWTWYIPGDACVALLCAGWLAGRGPLAALAPSGAESSREPRPVQIAVAAGAVVLTLLAAWAQWQPQRSVDASQEALALLARNPDAALSAAQSAVNRDPLSAQALFTLSAVQHAACARESEAGSVTGAGSVTAAGSTTAPSCAAARATLQRAVRLQPSNPQTWLALGEYDLTNDPAAAVDELRAAVYLDPESVTAQGAYVQALRAQQGGAVGATTAPAGAGATTVPGVTTLPTTTTKPTTVTPHP